MIYIVGYTFVAGKQSIQQKSGSVLQQLNKQMQLSDSILQRGNTYKVICILPVRENKKIISYNYQFLNQQTKEIKTINFNNTAEADVFIARTSGMFDDYRLKKEASEKYSTEF